MQLKKAEQSIQDALSDKIHAALETGNVGAARTIWKELYELDPDQARIEKAVVLSEYGHTL